jgi:3-oxocholest-4-en-26-oate---CoA ligase
MSLVGDAMARPLIDEFKRNPTPVTGLWAIGSGGARISPSTKDEFGRVLPNVTVFDGLGSSESGIIARSQSVAGSSEPSRFPIDSTTAVLDEQNRPLPPGSGVIGRLARRGHLPLGYFKDEAKTKATFVEIDGQRWVIPGDMAILEEDGTITLCGRGSTSINTGGEKVFPEEVEQVLMSHPKVADTLVVGRADDRWGERVVAIVQPAGADAPTLDELQTHARDHLAGYKLPRDLIVVDNVRRTPTGKADLQWAKDLAR